MDPEDLVDERSILCREAIRQRNLLPSEEQQQTKELWPLLPLSQSSKAIVPINFLC